MAVFRNSPQAKQITENQFLLKPTYRGAYEDLLTGLESNPKRIPCKYFYDEKGCRIFSHIMDTPEYYPTKCELEILTRQSDQILEKMGSLNRLNIVELGAGDGRKTKEFLRAARKRTPYITYRPIDISPEALRDLEGGMKAEFPDLQVQGRAMDLETAWAELPIQREETNLVLCLGSSIGNYEPYEQRHFFRRLRTRLRPGDFVLTGFDLKKDFEVLQKAYDDAQGMTRQFNLNLLRRLNRELGANFDEKAFRHLASYNPITGSMESWLISQKEQNVFLAKLNARFQFHAFEGIHVESSWKFSLSEINSLALLTGFETSLRCADEKKWFVDDLWSCTPSGAFF